MGGRVREQVGRVLRELREAAGLTLEDVEQRTAALGQRIPRSTVNDIESGRSSLPVEALAVLGSVLGVGSLDLLSRVVEQVGQHRVGPGSWEELARRGRELAADGVDLEAAWHFDAAAAAAPGPVDRAKLFLNASASYYRAGAYVLALLRVESVLDSEEAGRDVRVTARAWHALLLALLGRPGRARESLQLARWLRDEGVGPRAASYQFLTECWTLLLLEDDPADAIRAGDRAADMLRGEGPGGDLVRSLAGAALAAELAGDRAAARERAGRASDLAEEISDLGAGAVAAVVQGRLKLWEAPDAVREVVKFAVGVRPPLEHRAETLAAWVLLEAVARARSEYREAERWHRRVEKVHDPVTRRHAACYLRGLGLLEGEEGR